MTDVINGLTDALTLYNIAFIAIGVILGQFVGALPGIGAVIVMAIAIPFTFTLEPLAAIAMIVGVAKGGLVGGAIPAILLNTPGTADAAATAMDGYPLARKGKSMKAMKMALYSSVTGDTISDIVLITVSAPLAVMALKMGPVEILALMILAFSVIAGLVGETVSKGLIAAFLGLLAATVGLDPQHATPRLYFGYYELFDGIPVVPAAVGLLSASEILRRASALRSQPITAGLVPSSDRREDRRVSFSEYWSCKFVLLRGTAIGTAIGAVPGIGSTVAAFMSYTSTKRRSKTPEAFGQGAIEGVAATESANSAVMGANLIPMLTLGIPGSVSAALVISAFILHGIQPGPLLFQEQGRLVYGLFGSMLLANVVNLFAGLWGIKLWTRVISAPTSVIYPAAMVLCIAGTYISTGSVFGVAIMVIGAALGWLMTTIHISVVVFVIAFFLGPQFERSLAQTLVILDGHPAAIMGHPIAIILLCMAIFVVASQALSNRKRK
ncbi:tripartite tricarboxylate transporter permease [Celeribacter sp. ULVN23_4]